MMDSRPDPANSVQPSSNPYAAPQVDLTQASDGQELAGRDKRLLATIFDFLVFVPPFLIALLFGDTAAIVAGGDLNFYHGSTSHVTGLPAVLAFMLVICIIIVQLVFILRNGQTIGKRLAKIRVVRNKDGSTCGLGRYCWLRTIIPWLISSIPFVGNFFPLVDVLFIFGAEKRCLHDMLADTKVVVA